MAATAELLKELAQISLTAEEQKRRLNHSRSGIRISHRKKPIGQWA